MYQVVPLIDHWNSIHSPYKQKTELVVFPVLYLGNEPLKKIGGKSELSLPSAAEQIQLRCGAKLTVLG